MLVLFIGQKQFPCSVELFEEETTANCSLQFFNGSICKAEYLIVEDRQAELIEHLLCFLNSFLEAEDHVFIVDEELLAESQYPYISLCLCDELELLIEQHRILANDISRGERLK